MKKIILFWIMLCSILSVSSQNIQEFDNFVSDELVGGLSDLKVIREINGGTIFKVQYSSDCTYEMQGAFEYACKIVEEYLPPCLPITISVKWETFRGITAKKQLSKIKILGYENFTDVTFGSTSYMPHIKHILLKEYETHVNHTFYDSIPDVVFLDNPNRPDITISYNENLKSEFSYSLDTECGDKYDFISLAIRDIVRGLGFVSHYTYNPTKKTLAFPSEKSNPFENVISQALGKNISDSERLVRATQGSLPIPFESNTYLPLTLYAPTTYENGVSLNYFIPDTTYVISNVLSYNFGRGTICRDLNDKYAEDVFRSFLGWKEDFLVGTSGTTSSGAGNTSMLLPYNGSIRFDDYLEKSIQREPPRQNINVSYQSNSEFNEIGNYINQFHCYYCQDFSDQNKEGITISLLKKDGKWDIVYHTGDNYPYQDFSFTDWVLSYTAAEYARTCDGFLRARITFANPGKNGQLCFTSRYFVVDYLPQTVEIQLAQENKKLSKRFYSPDLTRTVRIYMKNIEGLTRVVAEKKRAGFRLPTRIEISDFKKGYFDVEIDTNIDNTFTVVGYNDNGSSRSIPIEIAADYDPSTQYILIQNNNTLRLAPVVDNPVELKEYIIIPLDQDKGILVNRKPLPQVIDISEKSSGYYLLKCYDQEMNEYDFKFLKE